MGTTLRKIFKNIDADLVDAEEFCRNLQIEINSIKDNHKRKNITEKILLSGGITPENKKVVTLQYYDYEEQ